jgi:hypothetical protein
MATLSRSNTAGDISIGLEIWKNANYSLPEGWVESNCASSDYLGSSASYSFWMLMVMLTPKALLIEVHVFEE